MLNGFSFGLYDPSVDGVAIKLGNNCVANFRVFDINKEFERIKEFATEIDDQPMDYGMAILFQFKDTEGNILEMYQEKN